jgi:hypothetical protein
MMLKSVSSEASWCDKHLSLYLQIPHFGCMTRAEHMVDICYASFLDESVQDGWMETLRSIAKMFYQDGIK